MFPLEFTRSSVETALYDIMRPWHILTLSKHSFIGVWYPEILL